MHRLSCYLCRTADAQSHRSGFCADHQRRISTVVRKNPTDLPAGMRIRSELMRVVGRRQEQKWTTRAWENDEVIGIVDYTILGDEGFIDSLWVQQDFRRRGVATAMYKHIANEHSGITWDRGYSTPEGTLFRKATVDILPQRTYKPSIEERLDDLSDVERDLLHQQYEHYRDSASWEMDGWPSFHQWLLNTNW